LHLNLRRCRDKKCIAALVTIETDTKILVISKPEAEEISIVIQHFSLKRNYIILARKVNILPV
jgi:hypothetical protein